LRAKNEIEECQKRIHELNEQLNTSKVNQEALGVKFKTSEKQLAKLQSAGETLKEKMAEVNQQKLAFEYRAKSLNERESILRIERREHEAEYKQLIDENNQLAERRIELEEKIKIHHELVTELEEQLEQQEETKNVLLQQITELKVSVAKLETDLTNKKFNLQRLSLNASEATDKLAKLLERLAQNEEALMLNDDDVIDLDTQIEDQKEQRENIITQIQDQRLALAKVSQEVEALEREVRESHKVHQKMSETMNQLDVSMGKVDVEMDMMIKKLEEEHQMTFDYACENFPLRGTVEESKHKIRSLKGQISSLGEINVAAITEYNRVKERYEFLIEQQADLVEAKGTLELTINEMDQEMTAKFKETFDLVRAEFVGIFKQLFGGGHADLVLTDPHDLLNTGVDIIAQPPGTKLKTSNLLSGGQKALTSIALLFS
ncbi:MAG: chromosome segregation protein SMC, partial [Turicibacter sp.]